MAKHWKTLKQEIEAETQRIWLEEPLDLKKLRLGIIDNEAGSYGQYFTTWDFANGMIPPMYSNDMGMYMPAVVLAKGVAAPEPSTIALAAMGLLGLTAYAWRRRR